MKDIIPYYKKRGETPKEALERLRHKCPGFLDKKLSYAGRLDPLAEGLLLVLVGEANKEREKYLSLPKTYVFDVLFGFATDTYDIAGRLTDSLSSYSIPLMEIMNGVAEFEGEHEEPYPPYSSKPVNGRPLFMWARENRLSEIIIPTHKIHVMRARIMKTDTLSAEALYKIVRTSLSSLTGDFRQDEIWSCWEKNLKGTYNKTYKIVTIEILCGSGTYVRSLAHNLGKSVGVPALVTRIVRTSIGNYKIENLTFSCRVST